jgi:hypothetical protein
VVKIRDGIYRETVAPANSGTEENPIVFEADAGAEPVISGADLVTTNWQPASHANLNPASPIYETTVESAARRVHQPRSRCDRQRSLDGTANLCAQQNDAGGTVAEDSVR